MDKGTNGYFTPFSSFQTFPFPVLYAGNYVDMCICGIKKASICSLIVRAVWKNLNFRYIMNKNRTLSRPLVHMVWQFAVLF